jgi:quinol monooxygenase YgiN
MTKENAMSIRMTVQLPIKEGKATEFEAAAGPALARVRAEDAGCEMYDLFKSVDDDTRFVMVESWAAEANLEAHKTSDAMKDIVKAFGAFLAGAPVMHQYE